MGKSHFRKGAGVLRGVSALLAWGLLAAWPAAAQFTVLDGAPESGEAAALCGANPFTIARMPWPSAAILSEIHARLLRAHFGCDVQVLPGDLSATASSMSTTGQPAAAPEMWIARIADIWNPAVKAQKLRPAASSYLETTFEGWFVPGYVAAAHPELTNLAALRQDWALFAAPGAGKGKFVSCPADWGCAVINRNMLAANGLSALFDVVEPANRFELDSLIAAAVSKKEPILFYYWQPNAVLSQFSFKALDMGPYDKDAFACLGRIGCAAPKPTSFPPEPVVTAVSEWVFADIPAVASYFQRAQMPMAEMNALLQALSAEGATVESVAEGFVANRETVWRPWLGGTK